MNLKQKLNWKLEQKLFMGGLFALAFAAVAALVANGYALYQVNFTAFGIYVLVLAMVSALLAPRLLDTWYGMRLEQPLSVPKVRLSIR